jgi:DNA polymerase III delta prime subunit
MILKSAPGAGTKGDVEPGNDPVICGFDRSAQHAISPRISGKITLMSYLVLARKYRPKTFADMVGQENATQTLQGAIREGRLGHAYLFSGPRGTGKTTIARILAKALNCEKGPTDEPCGTCERCTAADDGSEIDRYGQRTPPVGVESGPRAARLANGEPNIAGLWAAEQLVMADPRGVNGALVPLSEAQASVDNTGGSTAPAAPGRPGGVPLFSPEAAARLFIGRVPLTEAGQAAATAAVAEPNPAMRCEPIGILVDWSYDSPVNRITQEERTIRLEYGKFDYARTIHLDQSAHPQNLEPSVTGHSIGRWENDVLIVHTVGVRAGPLTRGLVHSEALELTERFSLDPQTQALKREFVAADALFFGEPYIGADVVHPSNVPYEPDACDERGRRELPRGP